MSNLKAFIKYIFHVDYTSMIRSIYSKTKLNTHIDTGRQYNSYRTIHDELISNLVIFIRQIQQDTILMIRILKNCWFFFEITLKSLSIYYNTFKDVLNEHNDKTVLTNMKTTSSFSSTLTLFDIDFYSSLHNLYELLIDYLIKSVSNIKAQDAELLHACKSCNRSLAMFIKVSLMLYCFF